MKKRFLKAALFLALILFVWTVLPVRAEAPVQLVPRFAKAMLVMAKNNVVLTLEQVEVRAVGNRQYLVGRATKGYGYTKDMFPDRTIWVPVEEVTQMVELGDADKGK